MLKPRDKSKSKNMPNEKFVVEFNKSLTVKHRSTTLKNKEIADTKLIGSSTCFLNFDEDRLEFEFASLSHRWKEVVVKRKTISYEKIDSSTFKKICLDLPITNEVSSDDSNFTTVQLQANFKTILLSLFSQHKKEFHLTLNYSIDKMKYQTILAAVIPDIDQKDWEPTQAKTSLYKPDEIASNELIRLFKNNFKLSLDSTEKEKHLLHELQNFAFADDAIKFKTLDFLWMFKQMLTIEDLDAVKKMEEYSLTFQKVLHYQSIRYELRKDIDKQLSFLMCERKRRSFVKKTYVIEAIKKMPTNEQEFDYIYLTDMQDYQQFHDDLHEISDERITGKIHYIFDNLILFQIVTDRRRNAVRKVADEERPYHVEFIPNRMSIRVAHRAIEDVNKNELQKYLSDFNSRQAPAEPPKTTFKKFEWMNKSIKKNKEQQTAIKNIVNRSSFPSPYVVFGPPGTGKTTTIIEAIAQAVKLKPLTHILVAANSNAACDDIAKRLLDYVSVNKILRIYSPSFDKKPDKIDKKLEQISNFRNRFLCSCNKRSCPEIQPCDDPTYEEFYTSRIIVSTLASCGRIVSAGVRPNHFDYIFIDEAASECEQYALIPLAGLGATLKTVTAQIVFSGDHKQLGPIVNNRFARKMGMERSVMQRLMETNPNYQRNGNYNNQFVTLLVQNYRSHPAILQFSNENFYDSMLVPKCPPSIANFACGWEFLTNNPKFPLLFHSTRTASKEVGTSLMNEGEIVVLDLYVRELLQNGINGRKVHQTDIGVISPYRAQRNRIHEHFDFEFPKIEVGTVDAFQGREKKIIVMSTVRSQTPHIGFVRNEKRLNVSLTRAKSLLIVIGNSFTLQRCAIWNKFVSFCHQNRALVGDRRTVNGEVINDEDFEGNEERPEEVDDEYDD